MYDKDRYALAGQVWVCGACGKIADKDRFGVEGPVTPGWDESCMLNSVLCKQDDTLVVKDGRATAAEAVEIKR